MSETTIQAKHFWCTVCGAYHKSANWTEPEGRNPEDEFDYYSECPECKSIVKAVPHYYANLPKMHTTGPRTAAGKKRSALNGMKHGINAQPHHLLMPANGKYDICDECPAAEQCKDNGLRYCPFKTDLMLRVLTSYENGDLRELKQYAGMNQARLIVILEGCMDDVMKKGNLVKSLKTSKDRVVYHLKNVGSDEEPDWIPDLDNPVFEWKANPLLDIIPKLMDTAGLTADQQEMTPKSKGDNGEDLEGNLKEGSMTMDGFTTMMREMLSGVNTVIRTTADALRSGDQVARDLENENNDAGVEESNAPDSNPFKK